MRHLAEEARVFILKTSTNLIEIRDKLSNSLIYFRKKIFFQIDQLEAQLPADFVSLHQLAAELIRIFVCDLEYLRFRVYPLKD